MLPNLDVLHILFTNPIDEQNAERKGRNTLINQTIMWAKDET